MKKRDDKSTLETLEIQTDKALMKKIQKAEKDLKQGKGTPLEQIKKEIKKGTIKRINPVHLLMNLLAMTIFPFVAKPMLTRNLRLNDTQFKQIMEQRKTEIPGFIIDSIKK